MAIAISVKKGTEDEGASKFFGDPTVPAEWEDSFEDELIFFCQIRLEDIAELDTEGKLSHEGYLYIFLDTSDHPYQPVVRIYDGEPDTVIDDFNDISEEFSPLCEGWEMSFTAADDKSKGIRLFGVPSDWSYEEQPPELFMQFDPLASDMPFMNEIDGFAYLFYGSGITDLKMHLERS